MALAYNWHRACTVTTRAAVLIPVVHSPSLGHVLPVAELLAGTFQTLFCIMAAHFEDFTDSAGKYRWRLIETGNGRIIADSGEGYSSAQARNDGRELFTSLGGTSARVSEVNAHDRGTQNPEYEYFQGNDGRPHHEAKDPSGRKVPAAKNNADWYWRFRAGNGRIIADGAEGYDSKQGVKRAIDNVKGEIDAIAGKNPGGHGSGGSGTPKPIPPSRFA